ncbi:MAG: hypothetical protein J7641_22655 [Cyanobacteria bacterium SID2]|nr:hypothetical protein [Cyanobacteria bacterium SID2]MBP0005219.1 hypothetical protein [Cyanobacteria bacterium SBC]
MTLTSSSLSQNQHAQQVYKGHLIVPRYSRSWWWVTVIDPDGRELKDKEFALADGQTSIEAAIARAKQAIDTVWG